MQTNYVPPSPVPVAPPLVPMQYTPVFHTGGIPPALAPVLEPLPDVQRQYEKDQKALELQQKETAVATKNAQRTGGWMDSFVGVLESAAVGLEKGVTYLADEIDSGIRSNNFESAQKNWRAAFRLDPNHDRLWREYTCKCICGQHWFNGGIYISDFYLGFYGDKWFKNTVPGAVPNGWNYRLVFLIPLRNILSIQLGQSKAQSGDAPPVVTMSTIMNKLPNPDSLMIFTAEGSLHNFYGFYNFDHCYNVLDHAWRASFMDNRPLPQPIALTANLPAPPLQKEPPTANPVTGPPTVVVQPGVTYVQQVTTQTTYPAYPAAPQPTNFTPAYPAPYDPSQTMSQASQYPNPYGGQPGYPPQGYPPGYR